MKGLYITIAALLIALKCSGQAFFSAYDIVRFDTDGNGRLDNTERALAIRIMQEENKKRGLKNTSELARFDKNNDGKFSKDEVLEVMRALQKESSNINAPEIFARKPESINVCEKSSTAGTAHHTDLPKVENKELTSAQKERVKKTLIKYDKNKEYIEYAIARAEKFLNYVDRKNIRSAVRMSYKEKIKNAHGGRSYRYIVSKWNIAYEIQKYERYGSFINRYLDSYNVVKSAPGMPDSIYVSLRYKLEFTNKAEEFITIVIKVDGDQSGTVVAYPFG